VLGKGFNGKVTIISNKKTGAKFALKVNMINIVINCIFNTIIILKIVFERFDAS
jgi:hypothetical protein